MKLLDGMLAFDGETVASAAAMVAPMRTEALVRMMLAEDILSWQRQSCQCRYVPVSQSQSTAVITW
jgi:hypothetical protein